ncbi:hypothetical protein H4S07_002812, partial [Coemansia furcata]
MNHLARIDVVSVGPLNASQRALKTFSIIVYTFSSTVSLSAFIYGVVVANYQPRLWRSSIFRVLLVAQVLNFIRFIIRPVSIYTNITSDFGCRMMLFLNNATTMLPVNLCIYCVIYLQLTKHALLASAQYYGPSDAIQRNTSPELLNQTLRSIIWFPITPIISLWLNILLLTINYYTRIDYMWLEFINVVLLALQSFFLAIALIINPSVRCAYTEHVERRRHEKAKHEGVRAHDNADAAYAL